MIKDKNILILGMARSGISIAKLLAKYNNKIVITDLKEQKEEIVKELEALNIKIIISNHQEELVNDSFDYVIKNPAIRRDNAAVIKAKELGIPVINEIEASYYFLPKDVKIITITGSNGKTTTTTMVYELLKHSSHTVHVGGNIGIPLSSFVEDIKPNDILVLEISDHQLCDMYHFKSDISVLTNLSETHIDFHGSYEIYKQTKKKIFNHHTEKDIAILNKSNIDVMNLTKDIEDQKIYFSSTEVADAYLKNNQIIYNGEAILDCKDIRVKGNHNYENIMVAIIIAKMFSITNEQIKDFFSKFVGVEHRIEYVKTVNGRQFYNDSKSTNNTATITALKSFKDPTILLMGGLDRNISFDEISHYLNHVKAIICFGETKYKLEEFAKKNHKEVFVVNTLTEATKKAYEISDQGDIILLSPACASWDQYPDFETRGNEFKTIINHL
ncbi:MAG: UDP-N-acetylmuramoyl-L-alanine--D-glutamate ligase [Tenericutes bacterium]|nr:UDP-N-acetylmuramoyl-L-alanine--D-glutamate ligase [Mycoplasmatota bacterium]